MQSSVEQEKKEIMENRLTEAVREYKVALGVYELILRRRTKWTRTAREQYCRVRVLGSKVIDLAEQEVTRIDGVENKDITELLRDIHAQNLPKPGKIGSTSKYCQRKA